MNPQIALLIAEALLKYGPTLARELIAVFQVEKPQIEQWEKVFALADKPYEAYVARPELSQLKG